MAVEYWIDLFRAHRQEVAIAAVVTWVSYLISLAVYRLWLSPLVQFPGPKLAALTRWYEAYYEIGQQGRYSFKLKDLHDKYGPIVRITPHEVHIKDSQFFEHMYAKNPRVTKPGWAGIFGTETAAFTTVDAQLHRQRRGALNPMFSRRAILVFEPVVREYLDLFLKRISEHAKASKPLNVTRAYPAYTSDIIMEYSFGFSYRHLANPEFESFQDALLAMGLTAHVASQFWWFLPLVTAIPDWIVEKLLPTTASLIRLKKDQFELLGRTIRGEEGAHKDKFHPTIFHEILQSSLPPQEKSQQRLADEAQIVVAAGVGTTAYTLDVATFHIVNTPHINARLHAELVTAFPDKNIIPDLLEYEKLSYLKACLQEALRLSHGLSGRNPRAHDKPLVYGGCGEWSIPAGTTVTMSIPDVHYDETIFPDAYSYVPERWLGSPKTADGAPLERYLVAFGRGPRVCLGMNLAWAELYYAIGNIFRRFEFSLHPETDITDVEYKHDFFNPRVKMDSKGVRLIVREVAA
ncbi:hypothetical protein AJ80_04722 [Polytolypa hystricis UAMH7299]|uniref:Cytochrome P450 n=1 Tax=Polytolypa hystricis (strain UAMH7299) TaxID=1447883 RepID=A0A2B7Y0X0_POLH7|nr:hypothetical protein AJ80_04722 [Polytolypa hystricis UAMH7299]